MASFEPSRALARLGTFARAAPPLLRGLFGAAEENIDEWIGRILGAEFIERLGRVPLALGPSGVDPFGLDPQWAKYALATVALLHRRYFRTDVHGIENVPAGRVLLIANHSGQVPMDPATKKIVEGEFEVHVRQCIKNVESVLIAAGTDLQHTVKVVVFLSDMDNFARLNAVYTEYWGDVRPARSCVQVARLPLDVDVEIEAIAVLP